MSYQIKNNNIQVHLNNEIKKITNNYKKSNNYDTVIKDLTHLKTYSIDDIGTLEIDDAISIESVSRNYKLWIHIASPASYVKYDGLIDKNARRLISTLYLSTTTIYMFPEVLINEIFSLSDKEKRKALSLGVIFNEDGSVCSSEIVQSLIKPNYQLSYNDADELIDYSPKEEEDLGIISRILEKRKSWRKTFGAREILESNGRIKVIDNIPSIKVTDPTLSRLLISEAMILYGDLISDFTRRNNIPVPYRVQECSNDVSSERLSTQDNNILNNFLLKKSMGRSYYSSKPLRHNSLGLKCYLHATSPIRRYADLLVHYQLNRFLNNKDLISSEAIDKHIHQINNIGRENINRYREDQKFWIRKWFENNQFTEYNVLLLNWINRYKNICIIYFIEYNFSTICLLKTKFDVDSGDKLTVKNISNNYNDMITLELISY